ncbi:MAG: glycosyltransferase family 2 protein [Xanthomonadaceae bacterium]|nr:glycosyltransferase family 2 protein [Xanthomonadaceae bacterium]
MTNLDDLDFKNVTVIIPAKDEEPTIGNVIDRVKKYCGEVIVVDGHSKDKTSEVSESHGATVVKDRMRGKGDAIRCSIKHIKTDIAVFIDADGSHDPTDIPHLIKPILEDKYDHVSGSRLLGGSSELHGGFDEFLRLTGSSFITACINWRYKVRISESQNGFRAIKTDVLRKLKLKEDITTIEQEMIIKTINQGYRLGEVPAHEYERKAGVSKIRLSRVWLRYGWTLFYYLLTPKKKTRT